MSSGLKFTIFAIIVSAFVLGADVLAGMEFRDQWQSSNFASATGRVVRSKLEAHTTSKGGTSYSAVVVISWTVAGHAYRSSNFRFRSPSSRQVVATHPVGSSVQVFYDPANPARAVIRRGVDAGDFGGALMLFALSCAMIAAWLPTLSQLRNAWFHPVAGGVPLIMEGATTRARLGAVAVPLSMLLGASITSLVGFMLTAMFYGYPPPALVASAWGATAASALVVPMWLAHRAASGKRDLVIDPLKQRLLLPLKRGEDARVEVPVSEVSRTVVRCIQRRSRKGGTSRSWFAEIQLEDGTSHRLSEFYLPWRARAFTVWLAEQLDLPDGSAVYAYGYAGFRTSASRTFKVTLTTRQAPAVTS